MKRRIIRFVLFTIATCAAPWSALAHSDTIEYPRGAIFPSATHCGVAIGPETFTIFYLSTDGKNMELVRFRMEPFTLLWYKHSGTDAIGLVATHCREAARASGISRGHWGAILEATEEIKRYFK